MGLKEAALDSPSFRATVLHISDQIDVLEKWLDSYARSAAKLTQEATSLENSVNAFLSSAAPSVQLSEAVLDHDYALLAMKRYGEGARDYWNSTIRVLTRLDIHVIDPIRAFLQREVRIFKVFVLVTLLQLLLSYCNRMPVVASNKHKRPMRVS